LGGVDLGLAERMGSPLAAASKPSADRGADCLALGCAMRRLAASFKLSQVGVEPAAHIENVGLRPDNNSLQL
jgi:hypothetical protein